MELQNSILHLVKLPCNATTASVYSKIPPQKNLIHFYHFTLKKRNSTTYLNISIGVGTLDPIKKRPILLHTFMVTNGLRLKTIGNAAALFFLCNKPNGVSSGPVQVVDNSQLFTSVTEFSEPDYTSCKYLAVEN